MRTAGAAGAELPAAAAAAEADCATELINSVMARLSRVLSPSAVTPHDSMSLASSTVDLKSSSRRILAVTGSDAGNSDYASDGGGGTFGAANHMATFHNYATD